ncbi:uncharacterized protein LOC131612447 isoform X1 [Vicia villosa]|uniref:uncharacterized protein LOC131612447 isoform X1 n=1 Tax=Vicia villosa TaxID=3911 RepID=UPI00273BFB0D|nr:uncharacterized protein LOC131612447 isoform X1 [Vicia villosa]XP_058740225.1 uncharacterized protein LOC131612447 isoform X1 [Vicia villosa]
MHLLGEKREILQSTVDLVQNNLNLEVIYGDTDSIMIYSGLDDIAKATSIAKKVIQEALVNVCGAVVCKEECGPFVSVTLVRQGAKHNEVRKTISLTSESSELLFSDVIPGKYRLEVKHSSPESVAKEDNWCWEKSFIDVNIGAEDLEGIVFVQKGYWVNVISTDGSTVNLKIQGLEVFRKKHVLVFISSLDSIEDEISLLNSIYERLQENSKESIKGFKKEDFKILWIPIKCMC